MDDVVSSDQSSSAWQLLLATGPRRGSSAPALLAAMKQQLAVVTYYEMAGGGYGTARYDTLQKGYTTKGGGGKRYNPSVSGVLGPLCATVIHNKRANSYLCI